MNDRSDKRAAWREEEAFRQECLLAFALLGLNWILVLAWRP